MTCSNCGQHYYIGSHCPICGHVEDDYELLGGRDGRAEADTERQFDDECEEG